VKTPIIIALDFRDAKDAVSFAAKIDPDKYRLKVNPVLFTQLGPQFVKDLVGQGFDVFLDLKFHDIPNTVAEAVRAAADLGVWMVNVHASGGFKMMRAASEALHEFDDKRPLLTAVTVLTSMGQSDLELLGLQQTPLDIVQTWARLAQEAGCDGVVCSGHEAADLRAALGPTFCLVTPGIRLAESSDDDQQRILTPSKALDAGANYLVVGRPVTQAEDPLSVLRNISQGLR
jgi:orotidine-5'-phosphate decarboxylase